MKKIALALLLALLIIMAGCGTEVPEETTAPPLIEVEVPFETRAASLHYEDVSLTVQSMWLREDPLARILLEAAELFQQQTGAVVTVHWVDEEGSSPEEPQGTDIFQLREADFAAMPKEYALDLTEMAAKASYDAKSHETLRQQIITQCGYLGAIAQVPYLGGVYYNTEIFDQCGIDKTPETWEEFLSLCQNLRDADWQPLTMDEADALAAMELHLRRTIGPEEIRRLMTKGNRWDTNMAAITALEQVMLFVQDGNMASGALAAAPAGQNKMALTNTAMMIGTNAECVDIEEHTLMDIRWGVFLYPGNLSSGTWMTADVLMSHKDSPNAQAAFDFLMLLASGGFDQLRADISHGIPADPANASPSTGAMGAISAARPEPLEQFGPKQLDAALKLWSGRYDLAGRYASLLELSK